MPSPVAVDPRHIELFASYLATLGADAATLAMALEQSSDGEVRRYAAVGLTYLFKSLDLIPDGLDDLGFMDDAFVIRVCASLASNEAGPEAAKALLPLAKGADEVRDFLQADYERLVTYVRNLTNESARGRSVESISSDSEVRNQFLTEVSAFIKTYETPNFQKSEQTLIKLRAFLKAKLPKA